jgi:hypothetical protein
MPKTSPLPPPGPPESLPIVVTLGFWELAVAAIASLCNLGSRHSFLAPSVRDSGCIGRLQLKSVTTTVFLKLEQPRNARYQLSVAKLQHSFDFFQLVKPISLRPHLRRSRPHRLSPEIRSCYILDEICRCKGCWNGDLKTRLRIVIGRLAFGPTVQHRC